VIPSQLLVQLPDIHINRGTSPDRVFPPPELILSLNMALKVFMIQTSHDIYVPVIFSVPRC
jgi:hypothetical protein